ncbi:autotransporter-associated beta strand repeat-containing protein [Luteolibacter yonseiensis]|uniref:Autotransporter-associated beta strand repeat-containing protein n=1 Tax=Luteolibacter yonseiensis TaxID=1144680 RepID=A0A934R675_9BACT|nr:autotransporter-associated beta strand repeat-containing protein [Luteolibacter yonseiensis]MBK1816718.1 autotransporter-associated beta strand repeat-containing protein [Luteolibacter yonseiensis]
MKPKFLTPKLRSHLLGASLVTAVTICFSSSAFAVDNFWTGNTSTDWNTASNWSLNRVPANPNGETSGDPFDDAVVNVASPVAKITATVPIPRDFRVGQGEGTNGRVDHSAGSASTGGGNWAFIGRQGGTGVYNLANTSASGGAFTGFGTGSGSFTCNGSRLYVGGANGETPTNGNGTFNVNTTGTLAIGSDLAIGSGTGAVGVVNVDAGTVTSGGWTFIGKDENGAGGVGSLKISGGSVSNNNSRTYVGLGNSAGSITMSGGTYNNTAGGDNTFFVVGCLNLPNATTSSFSITGGTLNAARRLSIGGMDGNNGDNNAGFIGSGKGQMTINGANALVNSTGEFWVGQGAGSVGALELNAGTLQVGSWMAVGRGGSTGSVNMTGGTLAKTGDGHLIIGDNGTATFGKSAGTITVNNDIWVGQGGSGNGVFNVSGGSITNNAWVAIGRDGGTGEVNMTGGTWVKNGGPNDGFDIGASGTGTLNLSAGTIDVQAGPTYVPENNTGNFNLSLTGEFKAGYFQIAKNGGSTGNVSLKGGKLQVNQIAGGGGTENVSFDGTEIIARGIQPTFISGLENAVLAAGNLKINSNGFAIASAQVFTGTGGLVKSGAGTLTLTGGNTYTGLTSITGGKLDINTNSVGGGDISVSSGAVLGVTPVFFGSQLNTANLTFGAGSSSVDINYGGMSGNPTDLPPLNVTNTLAINGTVALNLTNSLPQTGEFPLVTYNIKTGGNFVLGTLPPGVQAELIHDDFNKTYYLNIISVAVPRWDGTINGVWDVNTTENWIDEVSGAPSKFINGNPVLFNDLPSGDPPITAITLGTAVLPSQVTFNNFALDYSLSPTAPAGKISGAASLTKLGTASLTISTLNDYTGKTTLGGGVTSVTTLANGGDPSSLGAASASPGNLVFAGGILNYTGANTTINRGYQISAATDTVASGLTITNNLTLSGEAKTELGKFVKNGPGTLTLTNPGANVLANSTNGASYIVNNGSVVLSGGGTQTNSVTGEIWVGNTSDTAANLTLANTTLTNNTWLTVGVGNGTTGLVSSLTVTGSTVTSGSSTLGYDGGIANHLATANATFTNSSFTTGTLNLSESGGSTATLTFDGTSTATTGELFVGKNGGSNGTLVLKGSSVYNTASPLRVGFNTGSTGTVSIEGTAVLNRTANYTSVGVNGTGHLTVKGQGTLNTPTGDFNITDLANSVGSLTLQDSGTVNVGTTFFGKATGSSATVTISSGTYNGTGNAYVANGTTSTGLVTQTGGTVNIGNDGGEVFIGARGTGTWTQSAGVVNARGWVGVGRYAEPGANGTLNVTGGTFNQLTTGRNFIIGEETTGVMNISVNGTVNAAGGPGIFVSNSTVGNGTINLSTGGTLVARSIQEGVGGTSAVNFDGGTLRAQAAGVNAVFLQKLDSAVIKTGGITIDSNGQNLVFNQILSDDGSTGILTKTGNGALLLNEVNTYDGNTVVSGGSLGGTGTIPGAVSILAGANLNPGATAGTLTAGSVTFAATSTFTTDLAADQDKLAVTGNLNIGSATLILNGTPTAAVYILASYGSLTGTFSSTPVLPSGYSIDYAYQGNQIAIKRSSSPFEAWIATYFPGQTNASVIGAAADPDGDGSSNILEFALGGLPNSGSDGPKVYHIEADGSVDVGVNKELLMTIAVRSGTPTFSTATSPSATKDGVTYTIQGSTDLTGFAVGVTGVNVVAPAGPIAPPSGYEYRTFSLNGSDTLPNKGFLRVKVE